MSEKPESCGRCAMTSAVSIAESGEENAKNPFDGDRIEIEEDQLRLASAPSVLAGRMKHRLNDWATRLVYGE